MHAFTAVARSLAPLPAMSTSATPKPARPQKALEHHRHRQETDDIEIWSGLVSFNCKLDFDHTIDGVSEHGKLATGQDDIRTPSIPIALEWLLHVDFNQTREDEPSCSPEQMSSATVVIIML